MIMPCSFGQNMKPCRGRLLSCVFIIVQKVEAELGRGRVNEVPWLFLSDIDGEQTRINVNGRRAEGASKD